MKTIKLIIIALTLVVMASCKKEEKPIIWDGINDYKLVTTKLIDNPPLSESADCVWLWFEDADSNTYQTGWNGSSANETISWSYPDSVPMTIFVNTGAMITTQPEFDEYNVKCYRNDTLIYDKSGINLEEWINAN